MLKNVLIIIISVSILGIIFFSIVRRSLKRRLDEILKESKKK